MKRALIYSLLPVMAVFIFVAAQNSNTVGPAAQETPDLGWPDEVVALLENSCYDCHSSDSGNLKARQKLNFLKWEELKVSKQVGKLNDISEEVKEK
ncbi:MAG TPA: hypothetical protein VK994_00315, partial [Bacteroidales bacterium]|nr:hypothetical protein [Bacteroidales bacterium]